MFGLIGSVIVVVAIVLGSYYYSTLPSATSTPMPTVTPNITPTPTGTPIWSPPPSPTITPAPIFSVVIKYVNATGEYAVIDDNGTAPVDLTGWTLKNEANNTFTFPSLTIYPGSTVTVHTTHGKDTQTDLYWNLNDPVWNDDHDTAYLYDAKMKIISRYQY